MPTLAAKLLRLPLVCLSKIYTDCWCLWKRVGGRFWPTGLVAGPAVAAGFQRTPVAEGHAAKPSIAAAPRSRQLSEQVPPRRLLVALDDPLQRSGSSALAAAFQRCRGRASATYAADTANRCATIFLGRGERMKTCGPPVWA
jgi:hypothetical protein